MRLLEKISWLVFTILFVIVCIPFVPLLLLSAIFEEGLYDDRRDYYRRYL